MQMSDNCAICLRTMISGTLIRMLPCFHFLHEDCIAQILEQNNPLCPLCREDIEDTERVQHRQYGRYVPEFRQRIVECADRGGDWRGLANQLNVNYKTAYGWVRSGESSGKARGGYKRKYLNDDQIQSVVNHVEMDPEVTLRQLKEYIQGQFQIRLAMSTIGNYMDGHLYTIKKLHHRPVTMNTEGNKQARRTYVLSLNAFIQEGKEIVWIDETNFNLFTRRTQGWSRKGTRAVQDRPSSRGPNLHVIGAISCEGIVLMTKRRGAFRSAACNEWISRVLDEWSNKGKVSIT